MSATKDKHGTSPQRPLKPRLAATATKYKSGPAPKLAAHLTTSPSTSSSPTPRPFSTVSAEAIQSPLSDGSISPAKSLNQNVTPRSSPRSSRKSRVDSTQSTPMASQDGQLARPIPIREDSRSIQRFTSPTFDNADSLDGFSDTASGLSKVSSPIGVSGVQALHSTTPKSSTSQDQVVKTSFFRANEPAVRKDVQRPRLQSKTSSFLRANGEQDQSEEESLSRGLTKSIAAEGTFFSKSPPEEDSYLSKFKDSPNAGRPLAPSNVSEQMRQPQRRFSSDSTQRTNSVDEIIGPAHAQKPSVSSYTSDFGNRPIISTPLVAEFPRPPSLPLHNSTKDEIEPSVAGTYFAPNATASPEPTSPIKVVGSPLGFQGDTSSGASAAAEARRERKLLDLEISNSSLLVINRSLEREVRKQKAELRRYRRLTRTSAGAAVFSQANNRKSSWFSDVTGDGVGSGLVSDEDEDLDNSLDSPDDGLGDLEDDARLDGDGENDDDDNNENGSTRAQTRRSDARRLRLDLTAHKELLVDSQKMNLSLQRCLGISEQMMSEGQKALEEHVRVSEVQWGGRVLWGDEHGNDHGEEEVAETDEENMPEDTAARWLSNPYIADRDSGVDLDYSVRSAEKSRMNAGVAEKRVNRPSNLSAVSERAQ